MVAFHSNFGIGADGRHERLHLIKFNAEHSERYWIQPYVETGQSCVIMLLDLQDRVAFDIAARMLSPAKTQAFLLQSLERGVIPTVHAAIPIDSALGAMSVLFPSAAEMTRDCPVDSFVVWCIAAGGSSLVYRKRPAVESPCEQQPEVTL